MVRVVVLDRESGETFTADIGDDNPVAVYVPGHYAHGYEALTDCLFCLPRDRGVRRGRPRRARRRRGTTRASSISGARNRRSCRNATTRVLITGAGGQLGAALREAFPEADARTRASCDVTQPFSASTLTLVLHAAAWTDVDGAEADPRGRAAVNVGRHAQRRPRSACRSSTTRPTTSSTARSASRTSSRTSRTRSSVYGRTKLDGEREVRRAAGSSAARGSSAGPARTSSGRCCGSAPSATRSRSSTTSAAAPTYVGHLARGDARAARAAAGHLARRRRGRAAPGPSSPRRSSRKPGSTAASARSRPTSSAARRRGPRTRCCAASARRAASCRTGARACAPVWDASLTPGGFVHRRAVAERLHHSRLSAYQATVWAMPSSQAISSRQPSSSRSLVESSR